MNMPFRLAACAFLMTTTCLPAAAQEAATFSASDIDRAVYAGGDLPGGRSALTAKVQILLDRAGTSPGVVDGYKGGMSESAIMAFERRSGLAMDGVLDQQVWDLLMPYAGTAVISQYTITDADAQGLVDAIPTDYAEKAKMSHLGYTSVAEKLGERFHMDDKFIAYLNPGVPLVPGSTIAVTMPAKPIRGEVVRIIIDKSTRRVAGYDAAGRMLVDYPATIGSDATPSPAGDHTVTTIALEPNYTYNPNVNFKQGDNDKVLTIPPGPNGPVGSVWIDLSKPTYGIHGTPTPSRLFRNQSNGCVRLTNWDAEELAKMVKPNVTRVEFLPTGVTIADVTGVTTPATPAAGTTATTTTPALPTTMPGASGTATTATGVTGTTTTTPAAPVDAMTAPLPDPVLPGTPIAPSPDDQKVPEDTTEADLPPGTPLPAEAPLLDDLLSDALGDALPSTVVVPPATTGPTP